LLDGDDKNACNRAEIGEEKTVRGCKFKIGLALTTRLGRWPSFVNVNIHHAVP
jgi:hypothetical protein